MSEVKTSCLFLIKEERERKINWEEPQKSGDVKLVLRAGNMGLSPGSAQWPTLKS